MAHPPPLVRIVNCSRELRGKTDNFCGGWTAIDGFPPRGSRDSLGCFMLRNKKRIMLDSVSNVAQRQTILDFMFVFLSVCFLTMWLLLRELFPSPWLINWSSMWPMGYALFYLNRDVAAGMEYLESKNLVHRYEMPLLAPIFNIKGVCLSFAFIIFETVPKKTSFLEMCNCL